MKKIIAATLAFLAVNLSAWFCFWIGGGKLFTIDAGVVAFGGVMAGFLGAHIITLEMQQ